METNGELKKGKVAEVKEYLATRTGDAFVAAVRAAANEQKAKAAAEKAQAKYSTLPPDALVGRLIKTARRKTKWEGAANGLAVTGTEVVTMLPIPEPTHKKAAVAATGALLLGDLAYVTKVQTQLALEIAYLYGVPYDKGDTDDVYAIFKLAMGLKGTERSASMAGFVATEAARKQFRKYLRTGVRRELQQRVIKLAGPRVGKLLAEKYVLRLIPLLNSGAGYFFNDQVTKKVGRWATVKARIRSGSRKQVDRLHEAGDASSLWALPTVYWVGTSGTGGLSDNFFSHYTHTEQRLELDDVEQARATALCDDDRLDERFEESLSALPQDARRSLYGLAVLTAAIDLKVDEQQEKAVQDLAGWLDLDHSPKAIRRQIKNLKP